MERNDYKTELINRGWFFVTLTQKILNKKTGKEIWIYIKKWKHPIKMINPVNFTTAKIIEFGDTNSKQINLF
jgi:hypothetical protein